MDPAGQFASPFVYAGNNPVIYVDEDGEFAFIPILVGAALRGAYAASIVAVNDQNVLEVILYLRMLEKNM